MSNIYLIDTENVGCHWFDSVQLKKSDKILFFFSRNSANIPKSKLNDISKKLQGEVVEQEKKSLHYSELKYLIYNNEIDFDTMECTPGKNALDFQLVSYLGMLIFEDPNATFIIISDDKGYNPVVSMWKRKNVDIKRLDINVTNRQVKKANKKTIKKELIKNQIEVKDFFSSILDTNDLEVVNSTSKMFIKYYLNDRDKFYHSIKSIYGKRRGDVLIKRIQKNENKFSGFFEKIVA